MLNEKAMALELADVSTRAQGSKAARLRGHVGADVIYCTSNNGTCASFGPETFDEAQAATRMNLARRLDAAAPSDFAPQLDAWAAEYIQRNAEQLLKRSMTSEPVAAGYHPCIRHKESVAPLLQAKMSTDGPGAIRCWDADRSARDSP